MLFLIYMLSWLRFLIAGCAALPGLAVVLLSAALFPREYFQPVLLVAGAALLAVAALTATLLTRAGWFTGSRLRAGLAVLAAIFAGWLAALALSAVLNLTPLCVGQDNGDGRNNLGMCLAYTLLWAVVYTPPLTVGAAFCAALGALVYQPPDARKADEMH